MKRKTPLIGIGLLLLIAVLGTIGCQSAPPPAAPKTTSPAATTPAPTTAAPKPTATTPAPTTAQKVTKWTNQTFLPVTNVEARWSGFGYSAASTVSGRMFADYIEKASGGRLIFEHLAPNAILPSSELLKGVAAGTVDSAMHAFPGFYTGEMPEALVQVGLPFAFDNLYEYWDWLNNWGANKLLDQAYAERGVYSTKVCQDALYGFVTNFDPSTPESFKGKKIRVTGGLAEVVKALGASPVVITSTELYMAMKLGTIDGTQYLPQQAWVDKLYEVSKYYLSYPNPGPPGSNFLFNKKSVDALTPDLKAMVLDGAPYIQNTWSIFMKNVDDWALKKMVNEGYWKEVRWSEADALRVRTMATKVWDDQVASKSPRTKELVESVKAKLRESGKLK